MTRRTTLGAVAASLAVAAAGFAGYEIGKDSGPDLAAAKAVGMRAGIADGTRRGLAQGRREGARTGRNATFRPAYDRAYAKAYKSASRRKTNTKSQPPPTPPAPAATDWPAGRRRDDLQRVDPQDDLRPGSRRHRQHGGDLRPLHRPRLLLRPPRRRRPRWSVALRPR